MTNFDNTMYVACRDGVETTGKLVKHPFLFYAISKHFNRDSQTEKLWPILISLLWPITDISALSTLRIDVQTTDIDSDRPNKLQMNILLPVSKPPTTSTHMRMVCVCLGIFHRVKSRLIGWLSSSSRTSPLDFDFRKACRAWTAFFTWEAKASLVEAGSKQLEVAERRLGSRLTSIQLAGTRRGRSGFGLPLRDLRSGPVQNPTGGPEVAPRVLVEPLSNQR